jgi:hypothetical protein
MDITTHEVTLSDGSITVTWLFDNDRVWYTQQAKIQWKAYYVPGTAIIEVVNFADESQLVIGSSVNPPNTNGQIIWQPTLDATDPASNLTQGVQYYIRVRIETGYLGTIVGYSGNFTIAAYQFSGSFVTYPGTDLVVYPSTTVTLTPSSSFSFIILVPSHFPPTYLSFVACSIVYLPMVNNATKLWFTSYRFISFIRFSAHISIGTISN